MTLPTTLQEVIPEFDQIPTLHLTRRHGDYIDNIPPNDMTSHVMKGTDFYRRPFLALKLYPRELVDYVKIQRDRNYQSCLSLVALSKSRYLPVDIARKVETFELRNYKRNTKPSIFSRAHRVRHRHRHRHRSQSVTTHISSHKKVSYGT